MLLSYLDYIPEGKDLLPSSDKPMWIQYEGNLTKVTTTWTRAAKHWMLVGAEEQGQLNLGYADL